MLATKNSQDTQWLRWEVFKQDNPKKVHQAVGSVHAVDAEHALLTARTVFGRRPNAVSMWVVEARRIFSVTKEELENFDFETSHKEELSTYAVFRKTSHKRSMTFVDYAGQVQAQSYQGALQQAIEQYSNVDTLAWWLIEDKHLVKTDTSEESIESWFAPAKEKTYKQQSNYSTVGLKTGSRKPKGKQ